MSSNPYNTPLALAINASLYKYLLIFIPHLIALVLILSLDVFSLLMQLGLVFLVCLSAIYSYFLYLKQSLKKSVICIYQDSSKHWLIEITGAEKKEVQLMASSFISNFLIIINFIDCQKRTYSALIVPDSLTKTDFRQLIVRIKVAG